MFDFIREEDGGWYFQYYENKELLSKKIYMYFLNKIINSINYNKFNSIVLNSLKSTKYIYKIEKALNKELELYGYNVYNPRYTNNRHITTYNLYGIFLGAINGNIEYYGSLLNKYAKYKKCDYDIEDIEKKYEKCFELRMRIMDKGFFVNLDLDDDVYGIVHHLISSSKLNNIKKNDEYYDYYEPLIKSYNLSYELSSLLNIDYLEEYYNDILAWIDNFNLLGVNKMPKVKRINKKV